MRCHACEQINSANAHFCVACGAQLAPATWAQPAPAEWAPSAPAESLYAPAPLDASYAPAPLDASYAPTPYAPPQPVPRMPAFAPAPAHYPIGAAGPGAAYAPYGYAPAPAPAPSMVNTVTVTQVAPPPPAPVAPVVAKRRRAGGLDILLRALYFLGSGTALGILWVAAVQSNEPIAGVVALTVTIILLLLNVLFLERFARR